MRSGEQHCTHSTERNIEVWSLAPFSLQAHVSRGLGQPLALKVGTTDVPGPLADAVDGSPQEGAPKPRHPPRVHRDGE